jgi:hypothetical protein
MIKKFGSFLILAYDFSFLPSQVLAFAFSAFDCSRVVSGSAFSADFHVKPVLLGKSFLEGIHYRQIRHSPLAKD